MQYTLFLKMQEEFSKDIPISDLAKKRILDLINNFIYSEISAHLKHKQTNGHYVSPQLTFFYKNEVINKLEHINTTVIKKLNAIKNLFALGDTTTKAFYTEFYNILHNMNLFIKSIEVNFAKQINKEYAENLKIIFNALSLYDPKHLLNLCMRRHRKTIKELKQELYPCPHKNSMKFTMLPDAVFIDDINNIRTHKQEEECCSINALKNLCTIS